MDSYNVVSLFSGGMGLDLGLEETGCFRLRACVEKEPAFAETIERNKNAGRLPHDLKIYATGVDTLPPETLLADIGLRPGEVDLLVGGPPCQSFSTAGRRGTTQDPRGTLLWDFLRYVEVLRPKFFVMENVRGLVSAALKHRKLADRPNKGGPPLTLEEEPGSVVRLFADDLQRIDGGRYHMDCFEVNAVNYGAPQLRERALFIGNRYGVQVDFPEPTHGVGKREATLFDSAEPLQPWATLRNAIEDLNDPSPVVLDFSPRKKSFLALVPEGANWRSLPEEKQKESMGKAWFAKGGRSGWWRRLSFDLPSPTLMTMPNHASTALCHPTETRALSIREYARIQEFPDDWEFAGTPSQMYAQVGNAVPIRLGRIAGKLVADALDDLRSRRFKPYRTCLPPFRLVYVQSHVRTRQWFKNGEAVTWQNGDANENARYSAPKTVRKSRSLKGGK